MCSRAHYCVNCHFLRVTFFVFDKKTFRVIFGEPLAEKKKCVTQYYLVSHYIYCHHAEKYVQTNNYDLNIFLFIICKLPTINKLYQINSDKLKNLHVHTRSDRTEKKRMHGNLKLLRSNSKLFETCSELDMFISRIDIKM